MADYIDRENYCKNICLCDTGYCDLKRCTIYLAPAADVVEVRHGEWVKWGCMYKCTECDLCNPIDKPYCPNCGAKMDGKGEGE